MEDTGITEKTGFYISDIPLERFEIVYDRRSMLAKRVAILLFAHIRDTFGYALIVRSDETPASEHELRIGNTSRTEIDVTDDEFVLYATPGNFFATFGSTFAYRALRVCLCERLFVAGGGVRNGWLYTEDVKPGVSGEFARKRTGSLRVLTANIFGSGKNCEERMAYLRAAFNEYKPDIIEIQEFSEKVRQCENGLTRIMLSSGYREIWEDCPNNNEPVMIRAGRFDIVESGHHIFSGANNGGSKQVSWAVLHDKKEDRLLGTFSTHFYYTGDEIGRLTRLQNAEELYGICKNIYEKYGCPIIGGGDFNGTYKSPHYEKLINYGFADTHYAAEYSNNYGTCSERCVPDTELGILTKLQDITDRTENYADWVIDYIFTFGSHMKTRSNIVIDDETVRLGTDHLILFSDVDYPDVK